MPKAKASKEEFIKAYQESESYKEVTKKTGIGEVGIMARARRYRLEGIQLKRYKGRTRAKVSDERFVQIWNEANSMEEVIRLTGLKTSGCVHSRRRKLLDRGIILNPIMRKTPQYKVSNEELVKNGFGYWFTGLVDGEGSLSVSMYNTISRIKEKEYAMNRFEISLAIALRADDKYTLEYIQKNLECGLISVKKHYLRDNPQFVWKVSKIDDIINRIVPILEFCQLRTKKSRELPLFKLASLIKHESFLRKYQGNLTRNGRRLTDNQILEIETIIHQLKENRRYK